MDCPKWILGGLCLISWASASTLIELLGRIKQELDFEYLLLLKNRNYTATDGAWNESTLSKNLMNELPVPVVQLDEQITYFVFNNTNNRVISLVLVDNDNMDDLRGLLKALVLNLRHMTTSRVMFLIQVPVASETMLYELFANCWKMRLLNVMVFFADYEVQFEKFDSYLYEKNFSFSLQRPSIAIHLSLLCGLRNTSLKQPRNLSFFILIV